ncbi:MAG: ABC transporter permease [Gemmatimonadota bacterium]
MSRGPPSLTRRLLRSQLPGGVRGSSIVADLDEEYRRRPAGVARELWYRREAWRLVFHNRLLAPGRSAGASFRRMRRGMMSGVMGDLRHGLRRLARDPALAVVGVSTMGLGIGATVAIFTVVNAVLLEPLPYDRPEELVAIFEADLDRDVTRNVANAGNARAWAEGAGSIEALGGAVMPMPMVLEGIGEPRELLASHVSPSYFRVLGMEPALGRLMSPDAGDTGGNELLLSQSFWQQAFGGDPGAVGTILSVNGEPHEVVGILPREYVAFGNESAFYRSTPLVAMGDQTNSGRFLWVVARMTPGATVARLQQELDGVARGLQETYPEFNAGWTARAVPLQEDVVGDSATGLWLLLGSVGLLLAVACGNVANLFLTRATERRREMAVRASLGATTGDLARQLLAESSLLAGLGGAVGIGFAYLGTALLADRMPAAFALPRVEEAGVDGTVLLFALGLTLATGLLFGLVPALQLRRNPPARTLNAEGRGPSRTTGRVRNALVVAEVALSLILLVGAGLLVRSFTELLRVDTGIEARGVLTARVNLQGADYPDAASRQQFFRQLVQRVAAEPGVVSAGANTVLPMDGSGAATSFYDAGAPVPPREEWPVADIRNVEGDYFTTMGIEVLEGRGLEPADRAGGRQVVVVNRALAEALWPGGPAVGRRLAIHWGPLDEPWEVVGVVEDVRMTDPSTPPRPAIYHPFAQAAYRPYMHLVVRTEGEPAAFAPRLRGVTAELDPTVALSQPVLMSDLVDDAVARPRMTSFLMGLFAVVAAVLAAVGLYGVLSYTVARRVREIGLRMAVGADGGQVLRLVVGQGMGMVFLGLALGVVGAFFAVRLVSSLLFGVTAQDPWAFALAVGILAVTSLAAALIPAWRATRIHPATALRG